MTRTEKLHADHIRKFLRARFSPASGFVPAKIAIVTVALLLASTLWIRLDAEARIRQLTVENWNLLYGGESDFQCTTVGMFGKTLTLVGEPTQQADTAPNQAMLDSVTHNKVLCARLRAMGFTRVRFGEMEAEPKGNIR